MLWSQGNLLLIGVGHNYFSVNYNFTPKNKDIIDNQIILFRKTKKKRDEDAVCVHDPKLPASSQQTFAFGKQQMWV